jgi:hypothetical protein
MEGVDFGCMSKMLGAYRGFFARVEVTPGRSLYFMELLPNKIEYMDGEV